jgi:hypothetical protein
MNLSFMPELRWQRAICRGLLMLASALLPFWGSSAAAGSSGCAAVEQPRHRRRTCGSVDTEPAVVPPEQGGEGLALGRDGGAGAEAQERRALPPLWWRRCRRR